MHLLQSSVPPPHTTSSQEDHQMLGRSEDRRASASSDFNFSDSLKGRRVSWENDLGDSEKGPEASEVPLNPAPPRSLLKRSRAAEVHNQSEKRRRSKINEKMKALQNLIPNSNKTDKASMLDEAIEYLKQLQLQVQMLTMRNGLSLHPMCLSGVMQPVQLPHIGLGFEEGSNKVPKSSRGISTFYGSEENSMQSVYNISSGCRISNEPMVIPSIANVPTTEASFIFEPSTQAHYRTFIAATPSKELLFSDSEPPSKSDSNQTGKYSSSDVDKTDHCTVVDEAVRCIKSLEHTLQTAQNQRLHKLRGSTCSSITSKTEAGTDVGVTREAFLADHFQARRRIDHPRSWRSETLCRLASLNSQ